MSITRKIAIILMVIAVSRLSYGFVLSGVLASQSLNPPNAPTGLTIAIGSTTNTVTWTASAQDGSHGPATSYDVLRGTSSGGETAVGTGVTSPYDDGGLTDGTQYYYMVRGANGNGSAATGEVYVDNFNRADGNTTGVWTLPGGTFSGQTAHNLSISSNAVKSINTYWTVSRWNVATPAAQFAQATVSSIAGSGYGIGLMVRAQASSSWDCFHFYAYNDAGTNKVSLAKLVSGSGSNLTSYGVGSVIVTPGDALPWTLKLTANGTTISGYVNGTLVIQGTDSALSSGYPGIWVDPTSTTQGMIDNFIGGAL